jgi:magnesium transporter
MFSSPTAFPDAIRGLTRRGALPTTLSSAELDALPADIRVRALFSARVSNAQHLSTLDRLLAQTEEIEDALTDLEEQALGDGDGLDLDEVYRLKRVIVRLSRLALPLRDMVSVLEHYEHGLLPPTMDMFFRDLYDHAIRAGDRIEHARAILHELQEYHHTLQERKTSEIVRVLTVMSSIFIPLTFVVGIYGMNFKHMPELETPYGYYGVLGVMAMFTLGMILWFRRRKWL